MSHNITLQDAIDMTTRFRANKENILAQAYRGQNILVICETFTRDAFDDLLAQQDCQKIRIYFGMDSSYKIKVIAVGVDSNDDDILTSRAELISEQGLPCPPICPPSSPLNS